MCFYFYILILLLLIVSVMLSGESAKGKYPVRSIQMMMNIINESEWAVRNQINDSHLIAKTPDVAGSTINIFIFNILILFLIYLHYI